MFDVELTLVPAYGRDYRSKAAVEEAFLADHDFYVQPNGCYTNRADLVALGTKSVRVRYGRLRKVVVLQVR